MIDGMQVIYASETERMVWSAIDRIWWLGTGHGRTVIKAIYQDGLSQKEVAELIGVSPSRVSAAHAAAIRHLRKPSNIKLFSELHD